MTWATPDNPLPDVEVAIKWWLDNHFTRSSDSEGIWALDLYATFLDACVKTRAMPLCTVSMFGRTVNVLVPRSNYLTRGKESDGGRSGRKYLLQPLDGVVMVIVGKTTSGSSAARRLHAEASKATNFTQSHGWLEWEEALRNDKIVVQHFLDSQRLAIVPDGEPMESPPLSVMSLYARFKETRPDWSGSQFRRALAAIARVKRGHGGARQVVELKVVA